MQSVISQIPKDATHVRGLGTNRTNVHNHQYAEDAENTIYITTVKKTTNVLTGKETMELILEILRHGRKKKRLPN